MIGNYVSVSRQNGVVLIFALLILLILGLIASSAIELLSRQQQIVSNHQIAVRQKLDASNALLMCERQLEARFAHFSFHQQEVPQRIFVRDTQSNAEAGELVIDWHDENLWARHAIDIQSHATADDSNLAQCLFVLISTPLSNAVTDMNLMADADSGARARQLGRFHFRVFARIVTLDHQVPSMLTSDYIIYQSG